MNRYARFVSGQLLCVQSINIHWMKVQKFVNPCGHVFVCIFACYVVMTVHMTSAT